MQIPNNNNFYLSNINKLWNKLQFWNQEQCSKFAQKCPKVGCHTPKPYMAGFILQMLTMLPGLEEPLQGWETLKNGPQGSTHQVIQADMHYRIFIGFFHGSTSLGWRTVKRKYAFFLYQHSVVDQLWYTDAYHILFMHLLQPPHNFHCIYNCAKL